MHKQSILSKHEAFRYIIYVFRCARQGGNLVEINDAAENEVVVEMAKEAMTWVGDTRDYWLGASLITLGEEDLWYWLSGEPMTYSNCYPRDKGRGSCAQLKRPTFSKTFYFARSSCGGNSMNGVICEKGAL